MLVLAAGAIDFAFQQTIGPALPEIQTRLHASATEVTWLITSFALTAGIALAIAGPLGDRYGRRRTFIWSLAAFCAGSLVCATAGSIGVMIAGRSLQGLGGGVAALALALAKDGLAPAAVPLAVGFLVGAAGLGGVIGLLLTGVLVDHVSTAAVFWMLAAISAFVAVAVRICIAESPIYSRGRIDWIGAALLAGALGALMLAISEGNVWGWGSVRVLALFAAAVALAGGWVAREHHAANPLVDLRLLARGPIWRANVAAFAIGAASLLPFALVPLIAGYPKSTGYGLGLSSTQVALVIMPGAAAIMIAGLAGGRLITRIGARRQAIAGNVLVIASFAGFLALPRTAAALACDLIPLGAGVGLSVGAVISLALGDSTTHEAGVTASLNSVVRTVGQALGAQIAVAVAIAAPVLAPGVPSEDGFDHAFLFGLLAAVGALVIALVVPGARDDPLLPAHATSGADLRSEPAS